MEYRHAQVGHAWLPALLLGLVVLLTLAVLGAGLAALLTLVWLVPVVAIVGHFSLLTVTANEDGVKAAFGFGWPRRVISYQDVVAARVVRNKWYYGWGIRKVPRGWMYNVWGLDAVELEMDNGKVFRIGTDEPEVLQGVLGIRVR